MHGKYILKKIIVSVRENIYDLRQKRSVYILQHQLSAE